MNSAQWSIGNDLIDLRFEQDYHRGFAKRVLSASEYDRYLACDDQLFFLQRYFSAKESAYKYLRRLLPDASLTARSIIFEEAYDHNRSSLDGLVGVFAGYNYRVNHFKTEKLLYSWCQPDTMLLSQPCYHRIGRLTASQQDSSLLVRLLAKQLIKELIFVNSTIDQISIINDGHRVPWVYFSDNLVNCRLSLTHHGEFVAVALVVF